MNRGSLFDNWLWYARKDFVVLKIIDQMALLRYLKMLTKMRCFLKA